MKIAFFALSLFLLAFSTSAFVVDTDGDFLQNGGSYYILPVIRGSGGGVGLERTGNETCPISVVQASSELSRGSPVRISSPYRIKFIYEGLPLDLAFPAVPACAETPSRWTVVKGLSMGHSVKLTGYDESETLGGWFKIQNYRVDYKLEFCPGSNQECGDIGIHVDDNGIRHLVVNEGKDGRPFAVMFKKATESAM